MKYKIHIRYYLLLLITLVVNYSYAQNQVHEGWVTTLSVENNPNSIYYWEIYDGSVSNFVTASGNCSEDKVIIISGQNTNAIQVKWLKDGTYFYKVTETDANGCSNNLKIGKMQVGWPLPIELYSFDVEQQNDKVLLKWISLVEINNDYYTLYKSKDASDWKFFKEVEGAGNTSVKQIYLETDQRPYQPITYYKLSQTDYDGTTKELGVRYVVFNDIETGTTTSFIVYPNPTNGQFTIKGHYLNSTSIEVYSSVGVNLTSRTYIEANNSSEIHIDLGQLATGTYLVNIDDKVVKIVKK